MNQVTLLFITMSTVILYFGALISADNNCCEEPTYFDSNATNCFVELNAKNLHQTISVVEKLACMEDCAYRKVGFINFFDDFDKDIFRVFVEKKFSNTNSSVWIPLLISNFDKCTQKAISKKTTLINNAKEYPYNLEKLKCSPLPFYVLMCMRALNFLNCPSTSWLDTEICNSQKLHLSQTENTDELL